MHPPIKLFECSVSGAGIVAATETLVGGAIATGRNVQALECALGDYLGTDNVVCMGDMTHALALSLHLAGVGPGDEVMTLAFNCLSSNSAIAQVGARPVWVDIDPLQGSMSLDDAALAVTPRTKALVLYHLAGYPADVAAFRAFCDERSLALIEDVNNALGASVNGIKTGVTGDYAVVSFYPNRQVNGLEGAALICADPDKARMARSLRRFGIDAARFRDANGEIDGTVDVAKIGMSSPLNNVNASVALAHLPSLDERLARNRRNVRQLRGTLSPDSRIWPITPGQGADPAYWVWLVRTDDRDQVMSTLKSAGVHCSKLHHPNDSYSGFAAAGRLLPGTRTLEREMMALPCGWWLDEGDISVISETLRSAGADVGRP